MLEINANPRRRDLSELNARAAAAAGVLLVIDSDAHGPETLPLIRWGVATARRAWLTAAEVANTRPWAELRKLRKRSKQPRQELLRNEAVDRARAERLDARSRTRVVVARPASSSARRSALDEIVAHEPRVELARDRERR